MAEEDGVEVELIAQARALHAYVAAPSHEDEALPFLSFQKGDLIDVIEMHESGWWEGTLNDQIGLFPGSYVEIVEHYAGVTTEAATTTTTGDGDQEEVAAPVLAQMQEEEAKKQAEEAAAAAASAAPTESVPQNEVASSGPEDPLLEARRFALTLKRMYEAKAAELKHVLSAQEEQKNIAPAPVVDDGRLVELETQLNAEKAKTADLEAQLKQRAGELEAQLAEKAALLDATTARASQLETEVVALQAAAASAATSATPAPPVAGHSAEEVDVLKAELKLAKQQRLELQNKVEGMDSDLRDALDRASEGAEAVKKLAQVSAQLVAEQEKVKALETGGAAAIPQVLGEEEVLRAELKLAKQQRQALQTRIDDMDMELREALDKAASAGSGSGGGGGKDLEEARAKITDLEAKLVATASKDELEQERSKRERAEKELRTLKEEHETLKKNSGSSSVMQIKLQAMEKELQKTRTKLETAGEEPKKKLEEAQAELKEARDKSRKLEAELDVVMNQCKMNEDAVKKNDKLRKELDELIEANNKGKDPDEAKNTPTYKLQKLEQENAELRKKLDALEGGGSGSKTPDAAAPVPKRGGSYKAASPSTRGPPSRLSQGNIDPGKDFVSVSKGNLADLGKDLRLAELEKELAGAETRANALEKELAEAKAAAAKAAATPAAALAAVVVEDHSKELEEAKAQIATQEKQIADLQVRLQHPLPPPMQSPVEVQLKQDLKKAQDELAALEKAKQGEIEALKKQLEESSATTKGPSVSTVSSARALLAGGPLVTPAPKTAPSKMAGPKTPSLKLPGQPATPPPASPPDGAGMGLDAGGSAGPKTAGSTSPRKKVIVKTKGFGGAAAKGPLPSGGGPAGPKGALPKAAPPKKVAPAAVAPPPAGTATTTTTRTAPTAESIAESESTTSSTNE